MNANSFSGRMSTPLAVALILITLFAVPTRAQSQIPIDDAQAFMQWCAARGLDAKDAKGWSCADWIGFLTVEHLARGTCGIKADEIYADAPKVYQWLRTNPQQVQGAVDQTIGAAVKVLYKCMAGNWVLATQQQPEPGSTACPNLSGTFRCPAWGPQPPQTVVVATTFNRDGSANYLFMYIAQNGTKETGGGSASPKGIKDIKGVVRSCTSTQMIHKLPTETDVGTVNFINADGNLQSDYNGVTQIICIKQ